MLDDLNRALKPHGLQFAPDISTSNRATIGGMIANNSSGARSVLYGKTIDHVLELKVVLSDGSLVAPRAARRVRARGQVRQDGPGRRLLPRRPGGWRPSTPTRSTAASPRSSGASAATTSTSSFPGASATGATIRVQPRPPVRRLGGDARRDASRPSCGWSSCPAPGRRSSSSSPTCSRPWRRRRSSCGTARRRSRSSTSTCSTAPGSIPRRPGSATSSRAIPRPSC